MSRPIIPVILLCALPASGKSETRTYLGSLDPADLRQNFCIGETVQLDDYPYVHMMRQFDVVLCKHHLPRLFFKSDEECFTDGHSWGVLILMLNEDYEDLLAHRRVAPAEPTEWLMERFDRARKMLHLAPIFEPLPATTKRILCADLAHESAKIVTDKNAGVPDSLEGKTVVIEFARGGREGSPFPVASPQGYQYSLALLSREILSVATMLYIWVTPEISRAKNQERARPDSSGSILNHGVPERVMREDYGCDDIDYLLSTSGRPHCIKVEVAPYHTYYVPVGRFDNRPEDLTSFVRQHKKAEWPADKVAKIRAAMTAAFSGLLTQFHALHPAH